MTDVTKLDEDGYLLNIVVTMNGEQFLASCDFHRKLYAELLNRLPKKCREKIEQGLRRQPFRVSIENEDDCRISFFAQNASNVMES